MDIEEWELLSDDGFLRRSPAARDGQLETPQNLMLPIWLEDLQSVREIREVPAPAAWPPVEALEEEQKKMIKDDLISQVSFRMKENEFVDMKVGSPRSRPGGTGRELKPQIDLGSVQFQDKEESFCKFKSFEEEDGGEGDDGDNLKGADMQTKKTEVKEKACCEGNELGIWKHWSVTGIGALCSVGMAAAAICIYIFASNQGRKQQTQNQKLQLQTHDEDERIKETHDATRKLNQTHDSMTGIPLNRAHITFGGHYDGP